MGRSRGTGSFYGCHVERRIEALTRALDNEIRIMRSDMNRMRHDSTQQTAHIKTIRMKLNLTSNYRT
jgi:hypothetical protein